jgi:isoquinoline 1-oxidoreductase subunit beta
MPIYEPHRRRLYQPPKSRGRISTMLGIDQVPKIEAHVIKSADVPGGIGKTGATAAPPALRNPIYAANGVALRRIRIDGKLASSRRA